MCFPMECHHQHIYLMFNLFMILNKLSLSKVLISHVKLVKSHWHVNFHQKNVDVLQGLEPNSF